MRRVFDAVDIKVMRVLYPHAPTADVARALACGVDQVYSLAARLGLKKTPAYLASEHACRLRRGDAIGAAYRYPKGHVPANKGQPMPAATRAKVAPTMFKKGTKPHTWKPIGTLRIDADGYLSRKVSDTGYPPRDWVGVHRLVWMAAHGSIQAGHAVVFKPGRRTTDEAAITLDALECVTRAELMRRNTYHRYGQEIARVIQLRGALTRQINKKGKTSEQHGQ